MNRQCASTPLLSARGYRRNGLQRVDLFWGGSSAHGSAVYRDGERIATVSAGPYHDKLDRRGFGRLPLPRHRDRDRGLLQRRRVTFRELGRWR